MTQSPGDTVTYTLDDADVSKINAWRANFRAYNAQFAGHKHPHDPDPGRKPGTPGATGHIAHTGLDVHAGDRCAAVVSNTMPDGRVNLRVLLDGNDTLWVQCVPEGEKPGTWQQRQTAQADAQPAR